MTARVASSVNPFGAAAPKLTILNIRLIEDFNELTCHLASCIHAFYRATKPRPPELPSQTTVAGFKSEERKLPVSRWQRFASSNSCARHSLSSRDCLHIDRTHRRACTVRIRTAAPPHRPTKLPAHQLTGIPLEVVAVPVPRPTR